MQNITYFSWRDLRVGSMIKVYGRDVLLHDCDASTKQFYQVRPGPKHSTGCQIQCTPVSLTILERLQHVVSHLRLCNFSQQTSEQYSSAATATKRSRRQHNLACYQPGAFQPVPLALRRCPVSLPFARPCALQEFASLPDSAFKPVEVDFDMSVRRPPLHIPTDQLGIGSEEDSLRNVLNLIPKRKPVNYNNYLENFDKVRTNPAVLIAFPPA